MKTFKGLSFGMSVVNAGQRAVSEEPELVATSTSGGFRISSSVSRAMGVGHGEYVMFIKNVDEVQEAINAQAEPFVQFCEEAGLDVLSAEAAAAFHEEFDMWAIAKGNPCYDKNGIPLTIKERMTIKDKKAILENRYEEILNSALNSGNEELIAALSVEGMTDDDKKGVLMQTMSGESTQKYNVSKCANTSGLKGAGTILNFTDSNVWMRLKADLGDNAEKVNRKFSIDLENTIPVQVHNGKDVVTVKAFVLGVHKDEEPARNN